MSYFTNYLAKRRQQGQPLVPLPTQQQQPLKPELTQVQQPVQRQQPQIDTGNAIGSLAEALGPTPAEREARQQRMERNRQQMQMWGGLFNGLRQLGNLYYTARGARPQRMEDPSGFINQEADRRQRLQDDMDNYRQRYAMQLYNLQRQQVDEARRAKLADAQASWYDTRGEMARLKGENDRLKAEKYVQLQDGRIAKLNAETGKIEALLPYQEDEIRSRTNKNNRMGYGSGGGRGKNNGTYGYTIRKHTDPATGDVVTTRTPTTGNNPNAAPQDKREGTRTVTKPKKNAKGSSNSGKGNSGKGGKINTGVKWK